MNNEEENTTPKPSTTPNPGGKKVFDVMRPGKTLASPTSRPVITGHKPAVKDDQFVPSKDSRYAAQNPLDDRAMMRHHGDPDLEALPAAQPEPLLPANFPDEEQSPVAPDTHDEDIALTPDIPPAETEAALSEDTPPPPAIETNDAPTTDPGIGPDMAAQDTAPASTEDTRPPITEPTPTAAPIDEVDRQSDAPNSAPDVPATVADATPSQPMTQDDVVAATGAPVIDHAFVSHHKVGTKWWEWLLLILLIIAIAVVALNFLIDADIIKLNIDVPHTNLIK